MIKQNNAAIHIENNSVAASITSQKVTLHPDTTLEEQRHILLLEIEMNELANAQRSERLEFELK